MDSIGTYAGMRPDKNAKEMNISQLTPQQSQFEGVKLNNVRNVAPGLYTPLDKTQPEFNDTIFRTTLAQVLPAKGEPQAIVFGRPELPQNDFMYPQQGYARGQQMGLASDADKPMNKKVMPIAGFYDQDVVNVLGGLKA